MFHKDYLVRQIEAMTEAIACTVWGKQTTTKSEIQSIENQIESDLLCSLLYDLLEKNKINEAENLLFDILDPDNHDHLIIANEFYSRLNNLADNVLENADFSRSEVKAGLDKVQAIFSITL
jgi:hypothetical protein